MELTEIHTCKKCHRRIFSISIDHNDDKKEVKMMEKPTEERIIMRRDYDMVAVRLRKIFKVPSDEMILDLEWNKSSNILRLTTLKD